MTIYSFNKIITLGYLSQPTGICYMQNGDAQTEN